MTRQWSSVRTVAARWDATKPAVLRYIRSGRLEAHRLAVGKSLRIEYRISEEAIQKFEDEFFVPVENGENGGAP